MYVKHPTSDGDGIVAIAMPDGKQKELVMKEGVIDWPEGIPLHSSYKEAPEPEALRELKRKEKEERMRALAAELGFDILAPEGKDASPAEDSNPPKKTEKKAK